MLWAIISPALVEMLNADEYVRNKADKVIGSNDENAVIETLKGIIEEIH